MTPARRVRALSIHADYGCRHSGACCTSGWAIPVEPEAEGRLRSALRSGTLRVPEHGDRVPPKAAPSEPSGCLRSVASLPHGAKVVLRTDQAGRCVFFDPSLAPSGSCTVHRQIGEDALPSPCRHFPRVVTLSPLGVSVTLSHYCPTAAGMLFVDPRSVIPPGGEDSAGPRGSRDPALSIVESPEAFPPEWPYEGLDARDALPPLLRPGVLMDWPSLEHWERFAVAVLAEEGLGPESALDVLATAAEEARRWTPAHGAFRPFFEGVLASSPRSASGDGGSAGTADSSGPLLPESLGPTRAWQLVADTIPQSAAALLSHGLRRGDLPQPSPASFDEADQGWVAPAWPALSLPIRRWLAAKAFASWIALQGEGLRTTVAFLRVALGVLRTEAARGSAEASRVLDADLLMEAVRRADLLLLHLADPEALARRISRGETAERPSAAW